MVCKLLKIHTTNNQMNKKPQYNLKKITMILFYGSQPNQMNHHGAHHGEMGGLVGI